MGKGDRRISLGGSAGFHTSEIFFTDDTGTYIFQTRDAKPEAELMQQALGLRGWMFDGIDGAGRTRICASMRSIRRSSTASKDKAPSKQKLPPPRTRRSSVS
ncbi:hypothetical protein [Paenibacillus elgii]|uniref:hypothetical protein n=1 Tax=Paenibacillus elgii TaxID=189691 RepID=UPI0013D5CB33|nr:hypothetical protein [Paenibacillus elgii]